MCSLTLDEIAAAAELILAQDVASESKEVASGSESSDEGFGGEVDSDLEDEHMEVELKRGSCDVEELGDSGYGAKVTISPVAMETRYRNFWSRVIFNHTVMGVEVLWDGARNFGPNKINQRGMGPLIFVETFSEVLKSTHD